MRAVLPASRQSAAGRKVLRLIQGSMQRARPARGSPVESYLSVLGIDHPALLRLRYDNPLWFDTDGKRPTAMLARVQDAQGITIGLHRTKIKQTFDGRWIKSRAREAERVIGWADGGAVRLGDPAPGVELVVGVRLETTMRGMQELSLPGWAVLSAEGLSALVLKSDIKSVVVLVERDAKGAQRRVAEHAAQRWSAEGRLIRIAIASWRPAGGFRIAYARTRAKDTANG